MKGDVYVERLDLNITCFDATLIYLILHQLSPFPFNFIILYESLGRYLNILPGLKQNVQLLHSLHFLPKW